MHRLIAAVVIAFLAVACETKPPAEETTPPKAKAKATASAEPEEPAEIPEVVAIRAGKWKDPAGGEDVALVETPLSPCFGFKGYAMKLPEGRKPKTLQGARACHIVLGGPDEGGFQMAVFTDEVKVAFLSKTRDDVENVAAKPFEEPDAFLYRVTTKDGKEEVTGWYAAKVGPRNVRCNALTSQGSPAPPFEFQRAVIELCRTLTHVGP